MPAWMYRLVILTQVGRHLDIHPLAEYQAAPPPSSTSARRRSRVRRVGHGRIRLGPKVLHDHFLDVPEPAMQIAGSPAAIPPSPSRVSPIPIRMPVVNGIPNSPANSIVRSRTRGPLARREFMRPARLVKSRAGAFQHDARPTGSSAASACNSRRLMVPGIAVGQQVRFVEYPPAHLRKVAPTSCDNHVGVQPFAGLCTYRCSGRSPSVNSASVQPSRSPALAPPTSLRHRRDRNSSSASSGDCRNVQYPQKSRHRRVSGMKDLGRKRNDPAASPGPATPPPHRTAHPGPAPSSYPPDASASASDSSHRRASKPLKRRPSVG